MPRPAIKDRILVVDDDPDVQLVVHEILQEHFEVLQAANAAEAIEAMRSHEPDVVLLDLSLGEGPDGFAVLEARGDDPLAPPVIILSATHDTDTIVRAMRAGAAHYIGKTPRYDELLERLRITLAERRRAQALEAHRSARVPQLIGESPAMESVTQLARTVADSDLPILILGETGTGKGLLARCIHAWGSRAEQPFSEVNIAGLPASILDSELFGHERGSFTGAFRRRQGLFELTSSGTILLDEVGDLAHESQIKLLKVVEDRTFRRVGSEKELITDARVIAATHQDLPARVEAGGFRRDLYYRLAGAVIELPALRDRRDDIPLLVEQFVGDGVRISAEALDVLASADWPGNVRQLQNAVRRAELFAQDGRVLPQHLRLGDDPRDTPAIDVDSSDLAYNDALKRATDRFRREYLARLLRQTGGNISEVSRRSGLSRSHLHVLIKELELDSGRD